MITIAQCKRLLKSGGKVRNNADYSREMSTYDSTIEYVEVHYNKKEKKYVYKAALLNGRCIILCDLDNVFEVKADN